MLAPCMYGGSYESLLLVLVTTMESGLSYIEHVHCACSLVPRPTCVFHFSIAMGLVHFLMCVTHFFTQNISRSTVGLNRTTHAHSHAYTCIHTHTHTHTRTHTHIHTHTQFPTSPTPYPLSPDLCYPHG